MPFTISLGERINYEVEGQGPPLLLQHGGLVGSVEDWYEYGYVDNLKQHFQLILVTDFLSSI